MEIVVTNILSEQEKGGIFSAKTADGDSLRVLYSQPIWPVVGDQFFVEGKTTSYVDKYRRKWIQIEAARIELTQTSGALIQPWLEQIPGVGPTRAKRLIDVFQDELIEKLSDPGSVEEIACAVEPRRLSVGLKLAPVIQSRFYEKAAAISIAQQEYDFYVEMEKLGVSSIRIARRAWRLLGSLNAKDELLKQPYLMASLMTWRNVDYIGKRLLKLRGEKIIDNHPVRLAGACDNAWQRILASGSTAASSDEFKQALPIGVDKNLAIEAGLAVHAIIDENGLFRAPGAKFLETFCLSEFKRIAEQPVSMQFPDDLTVPLESAEHATGLTLTNEQRIGVLGLLRSPLGILQGGAGVGKTTVMKVLIELWEAFGGNVVQACLAGKAALTLSRATSMPNKPRLAYTLTRLNSFLSKREELIDKGQTPPIEWPYINADTLVIIDEASMTDLASLYDLLGQMKAGAHLLLVGDKGQLPPVGLGQVFHDLVHKGDGVFTLNTILRQALDSPIPHVAKAVREGRVPDIPQYEGQRGVSFLEAPEDRCLEAVGGLYSDFKVRGDVLVCAALKATVRALNQQMVGRRAGKVIRFGPLAPNVFTGDPVVCVRNRYREAVFNGMLGHVDRFEEGHVYIKWDGEDDARLMSSEALSDIELAYAITCHKAQGSSAKTIIIPLEQTQLLTREWLYTAITRATHNVILVGTKENLASAVTRRTLRTTGFGIDLCKGEQ